MPPPARLAGALAALAVAAFCAFGFLATLEPRAASSPMAWRIGYGVAFHLALGGAVLLLFRRPRGEVRTKPSPWRTLALAALVSWGPFAVLAVGLQLASPYEDYKAAAWRVLPVGPGLLPSMVVWNALGLSATTWGVRFVLAAALSLCLGATVAALMHRGGRWRPGTALVALAAFTACAFATFQMIRA